MGKKAKGTKPPKKDEELDKEVEETEEEELEESPEDEEESEEEEESSEKPEKPAKEDKEFPNSLPVRYQVIPIAGKPKYFTLFFVHRVGKRLAGYNNFGKRVTPIVSIDDEPTEDGALKPAVKIGKDMARSNAVRRSRLLPDEYLSTAPVHGEQITN